MNLEEQGVFVYAVLTLFHFTAYTKVINHNIISSYETKCKHAFSRKRENYDQKLAKNSFKCKSYFFYLEITGAVVF